MLFLGWWWPVPLLWHVKVVLVVGVTRYFIILVKLEKDKTKNKKIPRGLRRATSLAPTITSTDLVPLLQQPPLATLLVILFILFSSFLVEAVAVKGTCNRYKHLKAQMTVYTVVWVFWAFCCHNTLKISELLSKASKILGKKKLPHIRHVSGPLCQVCPHHRRSHMATFVVAVDVITEIVGSWRLELGERELIHVTMWQCQWHVTYNTATNIIK